LWHPRHALFDAAFSGQGQGVPFLSFIHNSRPDTRKALFILTSLSFSHIKLISADFSGQVERRREKREASEKSGQQ
jgi:hypothetical protein